MGIEFGEKLLYKVEVDVKMAKSEFRCGKKVARFGRCQGQVDGGLLGWENTVR